MKTWKQAALLAAFLLAQSGCDLIEPGEKATGGGTSIDGLLVVTGGSPAAGAVVRIYAAGGSPGALAKTAEALALDSVQANAAGTFQFKNIPEGTYNLSASLRLGDSTTLALWIPGIVAAGKTSLGVDTLHIAGSLVLQVRGGGDAAVSGALCTIAGGAWQASSDSLGTCTLTGIPPGTFQAVITHPSYTLTISADVTVVSGVPTMGGLVILVGTPAALPAAPLLVYPSAAVSAALSQPTLLWKSAARAASYHVQLATDSNFVNLVANDSGLADTTRTVGPLTGIRHYWRARAKNGIGAGPWSARETFMGAATAGVPAAPTPTYPLSGSTNIPATPTFTWSPVSGATGYHLEVISSLPVVSDSTLTGTSRAVGPLEHSVTYGWHVRARNAAGWGPWSAVVTVVRNELPAPQLVSPAANATVGITSQLAWNAVAGAASYRVQLSISPTFATVLQNDSVTTTSRITILSYSTTYYWRVNAQNAAGISAWSTGSFTTSGPIDPPGPPPAPTPSAPANSAANVPVTPTLTWGATPATMTYQLQVSTSSSFTPLTVDDSTLTSTSRAIGPLTAGTTYYWRVRAKGPNGTGTYSSTWSFTTTAPAVPAGPTTWTARTSGTTANLNAVTWTGSLYVAVGVNGTILTSPDGITWTARVSGTTEHLNAIVWTGTLLVAGGVMEYVAGSPILNLRTSPDGITWTARQAGGIYFGTILSITWNGSEVLATGMAGNYWTSSDGISWWGDEYNWTSGNWLSGAAVGTRRVMVSGNTNNWDSLEVAVSNQGDPGWAWNLYASGTKYPGTGMDYSYLRYGGISSVASNGSLFAGVVGNSQAGPATTTLGNILTSVDGVTWVTRATGTSMRGMFRAGTQLVAMAPNGATMTSVDGITWSSPSPSTSASLGSLTRGNAWVAVGANGAIVTSP